MKTKLPSVSVAPGIRRLFRTEQDRRNYLAAQDNDPQYEINPFLMIAFLVLSITGISTAFYFFQ